MVTYVQMTFWLCELCWMYICEFNKIKIIVFFKWRFLWAFFKVNHLPKQMKNWISIPGNISKPAFRIDSLVYLSKTFHYVTVTFYLNSKGYFCVLVSQWSRHRYMWKIFYYQCGIDSLLADPVWNERCGLRRPTSRRARRNFPSYARNFPAPDQRCW